MSLSLSQSDSQLARNEQLASLVLGMHLWHNELRPSDNSDEHDDYDDDHAAERFGGGRVQRGDGRTVGSRPRSKREIAWYHHAGTTACKATRISCGDIDIATSEVPLRVTSNGA